MVWVDAKYKAHLQVLRRKGWNGVSDGLRDAHRADLHQALAYATLEDVDHVDSVLAYPQLSTVRDVTAAVATVASGRRRVRLLLAGIPFGFRSEDHRERSLRTWRDLLVTG